MQGWVLEYRSDPFLFLVVLTQSTNVIQPAIRPTGPPKPTRQTPNSRSISKEHKTNNLYRKNFAPTLHVIIPQKRTMEETSPGADSMDESIPEMIDDANESLRL